MAAVTKLVRVQPNGVVDVQLQDPEWAEGAYVRITVEPEEASSPEQVADELELLFLQMQARAREMGVTDEDIQLAIEEVRKQQHD